MTGKIKSNHQPSTIRDVLCSTGSSIIINLTLPPNTEHYSVLQTFHLNLGLGLKIVPSSPHPLNPELPVLLQLLVEYSRIVPEPVVIVPVLG